MSILRRGSDKRRRGSSTFLLFAFCFLLFFTIPAPVLADGAACWCRNQAWVCTHYSAAQVLPGGSSGDPITEGECQEFCRGREANFYLQPEYTTAAATTMCRENCVQASSCAVSGIDGVHAALNLCVVRDERGEPNILTLRECCELNGAGLGDRVGYSGTVQTCPADEGTAPSVSASATAPIRLYNPLGADTDIPAFIGRGIRGVLGVIGAIALLMFVYGGVVWMTAGDSKRVEDAKNIIKNSVIGLLLIFFSYNLIGIFFDFFT